MKVQDLVLYQSVRWLVIGHDEDYGTFQLYSQTGTRLKVADEHEAKALGIELVANPASEWPMIAFPHKRGYGAFDTVSIPGPRNRMLVSWVDWVPGNPVQEGGVIYFNPELRLKKGQTLMATFRSKKVSRISVPLAFGTLAQRIENAEAIKNPAPPPEPKTRFNRNILDD